MCDERWNNCAGTVRRWVIVAGAAAGVVLAGWTWLSRDSRAISAEPATTATEHVMAQSPEQAGRYLVMVGSCNDCHTPGFMERGMEVPESEWLTGVSVGWRGPWGTTYASNLRIFARDFDEDTWVKVLRARNTRPPMTWPGIHAMSDVDLRAILRYIKSLPMKGEKMPDYVPPDLEPKTPYIVMAPPLMPAQAGKQP